MIKSRMVKLVRRVTRMGSSNACKIVVGNFKEKYHQGERDLERRTQKFVLGKHAVDAGTGFKWLVTR